MTYIDVILILTAIIVVMVAYRWGIAVGYHQRLEEECKVSREIAMALEDERIQAKTGDFLEILDDVDDRIN